MNKKEIESLWEALVEKGLPLIALPYLDQRKCKDFFSVLAEAGHSRQEIVNIFLTELKARPYAFFDESKLALPKRIHSESDDQIKGALGRDVFNVHPRGRQGIRHIIDVQRDLGLEP